MENKVLLKVEGMSCTNCALSIEKRLKKEGYKNVSVNFGSGEVIFELNDDIEKAKKIINSLGYKVVKDNYSASQAKFNLKILFLISLIFTIPLFSSMFLQEKIQFFGNPFFQLILCLPVYLIGFFYFGKSAYNSIRSGVPNMDVLIFLGSSAAFIYSLFGIILYYPSEEINKYMFFETSATIITLVLLGNLMEHISVKQTTTAISELNKLQATVAKKIFYKNGKEIIKNVKSTDINISDILLINTGDKIASDGEIIWGEADIDESMLTGESIPVHKKKGDKVYGATIIQNGSIKIKVEKVGKETALSKIIELVKKAQQNKPNIQKLGDKVSSIFVPAVILISIITFFYWFFIADAGLQKSLLNSIAVLVISCPCAMGLATPTAVMVGIGRAAKNGILIKGGDTIEKFAKVKNILFDKTGTITTGRFNISKIESINSSEQEIKSLLYKLEKHSTHPIAISIANQLESFNNFNNNIEFIKIQEEKGLGISAVDKMGNKYFAGSSKKFNKQEKETTVYLSKNNNIIGKIYIKDDIKKDARKLIKHLKNDGINTYLLSGDTYEKCKSLAEKLKFDKFFYEKLPDEKLEIVENLTKSAYTAMVGDGINDAPSLVKADIGISLSNATQVAIDSAEIIILNKEKLQEIDMAFHICKKTYNTIKQNLFWAFFYNVLAIPIAAAGLLNPMIAALTMAFSDIIVVGNSLRLKYKKIL